MIKFKKSQSGFSLVETLVAITILLIVVVGPMAISTSTARSTSFSSEQVQAFFLAQEGVEIIHAYRDDFLLSGSGSLEQGWVDFRDAPNLTNCALPGNRCGVELVTNTTGDLVSPISCISGACRLYYDDSAGSRARFTHTDTGVDTKFTRLIGIEEIGVNEVKVESTVTWRSGNLREEQSVSVETHLFNVYGNI